MEINQPYDSIAYYSKKYLFEDISYSHYSGKTDELFTDMSNITAALHVVDG